MDIGRLVQTGKISDVSGNKARVSFPDTGIISDWLLVIKQQDSWIPSINDVVLVIYLPSDNSDGFIIGRI